MKIYCASGNAGKLREFRLAAELTGIGIEPVPGLKDLVAPEETGATFEENACLKAAYYSLFAPGPVFADDSGLVVEALNGAPGVISARYAGEGAGDAANSALLLQQMEGRANRAARFVCVIALAEQGIVRATFRGEVEGTLLSDLNGSGGFGYDPLFYYPPFHASFGEVDDGKKFSISHRGDALRKLLEYIK